MIDAIFKAAEKAGTFVHLVDSARKKREQVSSVEARNCGNCDHWMKSSCRPEKELKQSKSCNSIACKDFTICPHSAKMAEECKAELSEIQAKIQQFR